MKTVTALSKYHRVVAPADDALTVIVGNATRTGHLEVEGRGKNVIIKDGVMNGGKLLKATGTIPLVTFLNIRADVSPYPPNDILGLGGNITKAVVDKCRLTGVHGRQDLTHGDCIQVYDGGIVKVLHIKNSTLASAYQIIMLKRHADKTGCTKLIIEDTNIRDNPEQREQQSVAVLLRGCKELQSYIELRNAWIEWPGGDDYLFANSGKVAIKGEWNIGIPPGGDFCPA